MKLEDVGLWFFLRMFPGQFSRQEDIDKVTTEIREGKEQARDLDQRLTNVEVMVGIRSPDMWNSRGRS